MSRHVNLLRTKYLQVIHRRWSEENVLVIDLEPKRRSAVGCCYYSCLSPTGGVDELALGMRGRTYVTGAEDGFDVEVEGCCVCGTDLGCTNGSVVIE